MPLSQHPDHTRDTEQPKHRGQTHDMRQTLINEQATLVRALLSPAPSLPGFAASALRATAKVLAQKRAAACRCIDRKRT